MAPQKLLNILILVAAFALSGCEDEHQALEQAHCVAALAEGDPLPALLERQLPQHPLSRAAFAEIITMPREGVITARNMLRLILKDEDLLVTRVNDDTAALLGDDPHFGWQADYFDDKDFFNGYLTRDANAQSGAENEGKAESDRSDWSRYFNDSLIMRKRNLVFSIDESTVLNGAIVLYHELAHARFTQFLRRAGPLLTRFMPASLLYVDEDGAVLLENTFELYLSERFAWGVEAALLRTVGDTSHASTPGDIAHAMKGSLQEQDRLIADLVCEKYGIPLHFCARYNRYSLAQILRGRPWQRKYRIQD